MPTQQSGGTSIVFGSGAAKSRAAKSYARKRYKAKSSYKRPLSRARKSYTPGQLVTYRQILASNEVRRYKLAIACPFHEEAIGARVPDVYGGHTVPLTIKRTYTITTTTTDSSCAIFPNLAVPIIALTGVIVSGATITWGDNTTNANGRGVIDPTTLAAQLINYRIVGMGVRVATLASENNVAGKVVVSTHPISSWMFTRDFPIGGVVPQTDPVKTPGATVRAWGIPNTGGTANVDQPSQIEFPDAKVYTSVQLAHKPIICVPKLTSQAANEFRASTDSILGFDFGGEAASNTAKIPSGDASYLRVDGFECVVVSQTGGTTGNAPLSIDIIYHIEGNPNVLAGTSNNMIAGGSPSPVDPNGMQEAQAMAAEAPSTYDDNDNAGIASFVTPERVGQAVNAAVRTFGAYSAARRASSRSSQLPIEYQ